jgi:hypothetical protein
MKPSSNRLSRLAPNQAKETLSNQFGSRPSFRVFVTYCNSSGLKIGLENKLFMLYKLIKVFTLPKRNTRR